MKTHFLKNAVTIYSKRMLLKGSTWTCFVTLSAIKMIYCKPQLLFGSIHRCQYPQILTVCVPEIFLEVYWLAQSNPRFCTVHAVVNSKGDISGHLRPVVGLPQDGVHLCDARVSCQFVVVSHGIWSNSETM